MGYELWVYRNWRVIALIVLSFAAVVWYGNVPFADTSTAEYDLHHYREMAESAPLLSDEVRAPFGYRVLAPFLAGSVAKISGISVENGFWWLTVLALLALPMVFFHFLKQRGISEQIAFFICFALVCNPYFFGFLAYNYFQLGDALSFLMLLFLWNSMENSRWFWFALALGIGVLIRETVLVMLPVALAFVVRTNPAGEKEVFKVLWASFGALFIYIGLRETWILPNADQSLLDAFLVYFYKSLQPEVWYRLLFNAFAPLSLLPLIFWKQTRTFFIEKAEALIFCALIMISCFLGADNERLMMPMFFIFYWIIAKIFDGISFSRVEWIFLYMIAFLTSWHFLYAQFPIFDKVTFYATVLGLMIILSGILYPKRNLVIF